MINKQVKQLVFATIIIVVGFAVVDLIGCNASSVSENEAQAQEEATVTVPQGEEPAKRTVIRPKRVVTKYRKLVVLDKATPNQVKEIVNLESKLWGADENRMLFRINCESTFRWNAQNGQYQGLGQFAEETFRRGMGSIGTRKVEKRSVRWTTKKTRIILRYPDGKRTIKYGRKNRQKIVTVRRGMIPKYPERTHTHAQVRIMARAMVGLGAVSNGEWDPRCQ